MEWLSLLVWALLFAVAIPAGLWSYRVATTGDTSFSLAWLFPSRPEPRLGIMENARLDSRRTLVLIRRDDVEHLIMTGGPVDVVIETGIAAPREAVAESREERRHEPEPPVFARPPRGFGQAVNE
jgi:flagellar protein FliO/FliZ